MTKWNGMCKMSTNVQKYKAFLTAVEYGSFTKAADILQYSQSAISRMIRDLETEWNVTLLERRKSGVTLTSDGVRLLPYIKHICSAHEKLQTEVDELNGLQTGIIRIGTFSSVATHWIPNIIQKFQEKYPNIDYELLLGDYEEIENWISEGRVDCGFTRIPTIENLEVIPLELDELQVIVPEGHILANYESLAVEELCQYPFLLLEKDNNKVVSEIFKIKNLEPNIRLTTWDDYAIMSLVERDFGISILPKLILRRNPYKVVCKSLKEPVYREIGFAIREHKTASLAVKCFMEFLKYR